MSDSKLADFYEVLQVSPHADGDTIERVFRHLAKRYHPDNAESGDPDRFTQIVDAFRVLSDPEQRASYDARYQNIQETRWRLFDPAAADANVGDDRRLRMGILSILYTARRNDTDRPGLGIIEMERLLGCPEEHMKFHIWYLRENGWIQRLDNGTLAITVGGVDRVIELGGPASDSKHLLTAGEVGS